MRIRIVTPTGTVADAETSAVHLPGAEGRFEVLCGHAPLISQLTAGVIRFATAEGGKSVAIAGGFVRVENNLIEACVEITE